MAKQHTPEQIDQLMAGYVQKKAQAALFLLVNTLIELDGDEFMPPTLAAEPDIQTIKAFAIQTALTLPELLERGNGADQAAHQEIKAMQDKLIEWGDSVFAYQYATDTTGHCLSYYNIIHSAASLETNPGKDVDIHQLIEDCMQYINEANASPAQCKADVIACFPMRMTRERYQDYVAGHITAMAPGLSSGHLDGLLKTLACKYNAFGAPAYGRHLPAYGARISHLFEKDFGAFTEKDFDEAWEAVGAIAEELEEAIYILDILLEALAYLAIIITFSPDLDFVLDDDLLYKDVYYAFQENFSKDGFEAIQESLEENLDTALMPILDECLSLEKTLDALFQKAAQQEPDEHMRELNAMYDAINGLYHISLIALCLPADGIFVAADENADADAAKAKIQQFLDYLQDSVQSFPNAKRKLIRQWFLNVLPCAMPDRDFQDYLHYSFDGTKNLAERITILDTLGKLFEEQGFTLWENDHDHGHGHNHHSHGHHHHSHGHHHHHHDEQCDCGHHH